MKVVGKITDLALVLSLLFSIGSTICPVQAFSPDQAADAEVTKVWSDPEKIKKGVVVLVHGLSQHASSLNLLADSLANQGFLVVGMDQRGHGNWHKDSRKDKEGYRCNFKKTVKDLNHLIAELKESNKGLPLFVVGESIGASLAMKAAGSGGEQVSGLILCSCGAKCTRFKTSWIIKDCLSAIFRPFSEISVRKYQAEFACENPQILSQTLSDKDARLAFRPREIFRINRFFAHNTRYAKRLNPSTDLLILSGSLDKLTTPKHCRKLLSVAASNNKSLVTIENSGHMMIGRPDLFPQTKNVVSNWLTNEVNRKLASGN